MKLVLITHFTIWHNKAKVLSCQHVINIKIINEIVFTNLFFNKCLLAGRSVILTTPLQPHVMAQQPHVTDDPNPGWGRSRTLSRWQYTLTGMRGPQGVEKRMPLWCCGVLLTCDTGGWQLTEEVTHDLMASTKQDSVLHVHCAYHCINAEYRIIMTHIYEIKYVIVVIMHIIICIVLCRV